MVQLRMFLILAMAALAGCGSHFEAYNYDTRDDAKLKQDDYSVRLKSRELKMERKMPFGVKRNVSRPLVPQPDAPPPPELAQ